MPKKDREWFEEQFPGYTFVWDGTVEHHDHPVAHLCTELNEINMVEDLVRNDKMWIDLFGNGARDRKYKRKCINMYTMATPKDYLRHQNPGPTDVRFDMEKLCDPNHAYGRIDDITCTHGLYYLTMADVGRIVNTSSRRRMKATVHRHSSTHGFLNHGEQEYWVSEQGTVTQVNVKTGEKYTHPSMEALFHQGSAKTESGGVAWTIKAGGGDTFEITFVGCPNEICETLLPLKFLKPETREVMTYSGVTVKTFLHWTWIQASTHDGEVQLYDVELYEQLRRYVAGKQRTPKLKSEVMNHARRLCNPKDIIALHGGGAADVQAASMHQYVEAAFYVDARAEVDCAVSMHRDNAKLVATLNNYYEKGALPTDYTVLTGAACITSRAFSEAAIKVIDHLRACQEISVRDYIANNLPGEYLAKLAIDYDLDDRIPGPWGW